MPRSYPQTMISLPLRTLQGRQLMNPQRIRMENAGHGSPMIGGTGGQVEVCQGGPEVHQTRPRTNKQVSLFIRSRSGLVHSWATDRDPLRRYFAGPGGSLAIPSGSLGSGILETLLRFKVLRVPICSSEGSNWSVGDLSGGGRSAPNPNGIE